MNPQVSQRKPREGSMGPFWVVVALGVVCLVVFAAVFQGKAKGGAGKGKITPEQSREAVPKTSLELLPPAAGTVKPAAMQGKVVVMHFWASWCGPCRSEFPEFAKYVNEARTQSGVVVLPISTDVTSENATGFLAEMGVTAKSYLDSDGLSQDLGVAYIPTTIILDKKGRVAWRSTGAADWSAKGVPALVEKLREE